MALRYKYYRYIFGVYPSIVPTQSYTCLLPPSIIVSCIFVKHLIIWHFVYFVTADKAVLVFPEIFKMYAAIRVSVPRREQ